MATANEWGRLIERRAVPALGPVAVRGRLVYRVPVDGILAGIYADLSGFTKGASYLWVFAQPFYVPSEHLDFAIGTRLGGGAHAYTLEGLATNDAATYMGPAEEFFTRHGTPASLLGQSDWKDRANIRMVEVEAYPLVWCDRSDEARQVLSVVDDLPTSYDWEREVAERTCHVDELLGSSVAAARPQLEHWRDETVAHLNLPTTRMQTSAQHDARSNRCFGRGVPDAGPPVTTRRLCLLATTR
jgi:hypothetical protein